MTEPLRWIVDGLIPAAAHNLAWLTETFDVVVKFEASSEAIVRGDTFPVLVVWRDGLVPGHDAPGPLWMRWVGGRFLTVDEVTAA